MTPVPDAYGASPRASEQAERVTPVATSSNLGVSAGDAADDADPAAVPVEGGEKMTKRVRPRAKRGEGDRLKEEILDAADRLLLEAGSESAVSIQSITDAVGCTPPAIYLHFADKDALMLEVCARHFLRFAAALDASDEGGDPMELLRKRGRAYVEYGLENPEPYRILFMQKPGASAGRTMATTAVEAFAPLTKAVAQCIERGLFPESDPFVISCTLWASVHGLTSLMISNPDYPWPPLDELLDIGIGVTTGNQSR